MSEYITVDNPEALKALWYLFSELYTFFRFPDNIKRLGLAVEEKDRLLDPFRQKTFALKQEFPELSKYWDEICGLLERIIADRKFYQTEMDRINYARYPSRYKKPRTEPLGAFFKRWMEYARAAYQNSLRA